MSFDKSEALRKAEGHFRKGEISAAITVYRKIVETDPYDFSSINKLGDLYAGAGRIKDAIEDFSRIADLHLANGSATRAAYVLKKTLELDPSDAAVRMKLGEVYSHENMMERAHEAFLLAGSAFMRAGDIDKALEANQKALAIRPDSQQARAAIATLENEAASSESRSHKQAKSGGSAPATASDSRSHGGKRNHTSGSLDHLLSGFDDDFVVQQISKAEALVGFGEVTQAVAMLKEVLNSAPDRIAVHIKLKDIYLRAEMMSEACVEYKELARIYAARGEVARAKDYEVRAERLSQMIAPLVPPIDAQASASVKSAEPQPVISKSDEENNGRSSEPPKTTGDIAPAVNDVARPAEELTAAVAVQGSVRKPRVESQPIEDHFNNSNKLDLQVKETALALTVKPDQALAQVSALDSQTSFPPTSVLGLTRIETNARPVVETKSRRWMYATLVIVICLTALAVATIKGLSMYDARLNKQYEELNHASPINLLPDLPELPALDEPQNVDKDAVVLEPQPTQVVKPSDSSSEQQVREDVERKFEAASKPAPVMTNEQPRVSRPLSLSPPLVSPALDNQAGVDRNSPGGVSVGVPENPAVAAPMPAMPAPPRKASVTIPGEAIRRVQPDYPASARSARQAGTVSVEIVINENGDVISARAISGSDLLKNAAARAARAWKFKPSMRDGKPVKSTSSITFNFKL
jgi:TonB family protein